jgi:glucose/arabinose dehydrogenase
MARRLIQAISVLALAGCGASPSASAGQPAGDPPFTVSEVTRFDAPWAMSFLPGSGVRMTNSALITEKTGKMWLVDVTTGAKRPVAGVPRVIVSSQGGLLDVVASPDFAGNQQIYLTYSEPSRNGGSGLAMARAKLVDIASSPRLDGLTVLWRDPAGGQGGQFGARIAFAPDGGSIFLSSGERQRFTPAQDPNQPLGKILHLTLDGKPAPGNPMAGRTGAASVMVTDPPRDTAAAKDAPGRRIARPAPNLTPAETWSTGHRNPLGLAFSPDGRLWSTEMGPRGGDEVNLILPGRNYGWPNVSNGSNYDGVDIPDHRPGDGYEPPKLWWNPSISPAGLIIYTGDLFPQWKGDALFGALSAEAFVHVRIRGDQASKADQWDMGQRIREVEQGPRGEVYLLEDAPGGRVLRLEPKR